MVAGPNPDIHPPFAEVIWRLHMRKQALENAPENLPSDLGLHHPPWGRHGAGAVFLAATGLAHNPSVGVRHLLLEGLARAMRLWQLRRGLSQLSARDMRHARQVTARLPDARAPLRQQLQAAMVALAVCEAPGHHSPCPVPQPLAALEHTRRHMRPLHRRPLRSDWSWG